MSAIAFPVLTNALVTACLTVIDMFDCPNNIDNFVALIINIYYHHLIGNHIFEYFPEYKFS